MVRDQEAWMELTWDNGDVVTVFGYESETELEEYIYPVFYKIYEMCKSNISLDALNIRLMNDTEFEEKVRSDEVEFETPEWDRHSPETEQAGITVAPHPDNDDLSIITVTVRMSEDKTPEMIQADIAHEVGHFIWYVCLDSGVRSKYQKVTRWITDCEPGDNNLERMLVKKAGAQCWVSSRQFSDLYEDFAETFRYMLGYRSDDGIDVRFVVVDRIRKKFFRQYIFNRSNQRGEVTWT